MKIIFTTTLTAWIIFIHVFSGCEKMEHRPSTDLESIFKFRLYGSMNEWRNSDVYGIITGTKISKNNGYYTLSSSDPHGTPNSISMNIVTNDLQVASYNTFLNGPIAINAPLARLEMNQLVSATCYDAGDFLNITITSIHDTKYADGFFTIRLTQLTSTGTNKVDIEEGEFHNVIIYQ